MSFLMALFRRNQAFLKIRSSSVPRLAGTLQSGALQYLGDEELISSPLASWCILSTPLRLQRVRVRREKLI